MTRFGYSCLAVLSVLTTAGVSYAQHHHHGSEPPLPKEAVAVLVPMSGSHVTGTVLLAQEGKAVHVTGTIRGLTPGLHGFHIHAFGDLRDPKGMSVGGHYDHNGHKHGGPESHEHHAGDLGNVKAGQDGTAKVNVHVPNLKLHFIVGRSLVVHADPDDLKSQPSGNSGARVGVGVIGLAEVKAPATR